MNRAKKAYLSPKSVLKEYFSKIYHDFPFFVISLTVLTLGIVSVWNLLPPLTLHLRFLILASLVFFSCVLAHFLYKEMQKDSPEIKEKRVS